MTSHQYTKPEDIPLPKYLDKNPDLKLKIQKYLATIPPAEKDLLLKRFTDFIDGKITWAELKGIPKSSLKHLAEMAYYQLQGGQYDKAETLFKGLSIIDHTNWYYRAALGTLYQKKKQFEEAIEEYSMALTLEEEEISSLTNRGECYLHLGNYDEAKLDLKKAIDLDPKKDNKWGKRARVLYNLVAKLK